MKMPNRFEPIPLAALSVCLLAFVPCAHAQDAATPTPEKATPAPEVVTPSPETVSPSPEVSALPPSEAGPQVNGTQVVPSFEAGPTPGMTPVTPMHWGPVDVSLSIRYQYLYGDGIHSSPGHPSTTAVQTIAPSALFGLGTHWTLDYTPTWTIYSNRAFSDAVNHAASLSGATSYEDWALHLSGNFDSSSYPLVETGGQTKQHSYATAFNATHSVGNRMLLDLGVSENTRLPDNFPDSREWSTTDWLHYRLAPDWDGAIGLGLGYVDVSQGPNMTYERPQARIGWRTTEKTSFDLQGGVEIRKFHASGARTQHNPILSASFNYQPVETTTLSLQVGRNVATSYFANQVTVNTHWTASLQQRLLGEFYFTASYAHQKAEYVSSAANFTAGREDKYDSVNLRLSTIFLRHGTIAALYRVSRNDSNQSAFGFTSHQIGFEISYRF